MRDKEWVYEESDGKRQMRLVSPPFLSRLSHSLFSVSQPVQEEPIRERSPVKKAQPMAPKPTARTIDVKVEVGNSAETKEEVRKDFESSLRNNDDEKLPEITILQIVKHTEPPPSPTTSRPSYAPTTSLPSYAPTMNLTRLTQPYTLSSNDRRFRGLHFKRFSGSAAVTGWSIFEKRPTASLNVSITLAVVVSEDQFHPERFVDSWDG